MKIYENETIQEVYKELIEDLKSSEVVGNTKEINNCCLVVNKPTTDNFYLPYRSVSERYANGELEWYFTGNNKLEFIKQYGSMWERLSDDGVTNNSAYGYILMKKYGYNQIEQIIELLKKDPTSRRAVLNIEDPTLNKITTKDYQCTVALQFLLRNGKLEETVIMRSNDVYFGLPYDYIFFETLGEYIASELGVELGTYTHFSGSMHMYLRDEEKFNEKENTPIKIDKQRVLSLYKKEK